MPTTVQTSKRDVRRLVAKEVAAQIATDAVASIDVINSDPPNFRPSKDKPAPKEKPGPKPPKKK